MAVNTRVSSGTIAAIALRQILTLPAIVAWLRGTLIDILFATTTGETSRTEALHIVSHGHTESTMLASTLSTDHGLALLASLGSCAIGSHVAGAFVTALCAWRALVVMKRARRAGCQTSGRVGTRSTLGTAKGFRGSRWLIGKGLRWTSLAILEATGRWFGGERVAWTLQTGHKTSG